MKYCKDCVGFDECNTTGRTVEFAVDDGGCIDFDERKPQTNAQKIRAMSDEELAVFLSRDLKEPCDYCQLAVFEGACTETLCEDAMMKWLQQPAEGE